MILYVILISLCLDNVFLFPSHSCNAKTKFLLFFLDCRGELNEQLDFMNTFVTYFKSLSKTNQVFFEYRIIKNDHQYDFDITSDYKCNQSLPIVDVMRESKHVIINRTFFRCAAFKIAIIFISNSLSADLEFVLGTMDLERNGNLDLLRFFILQSSQTMTMDFLYGIESFKDLNVEDVFLKMCSMGHEDVSYSYSAGKYFDTKYYIATHLSTTSSYQAVCFCDEHHGADILSLETYDEGVFISQVLNNLSVKSDANVLVTLGKFKRERYQWLLATAGTHTFLPHIHIGDNNGCFYINISLYGNSCREKLKCNLESFKEKVDCEQTLQNAVVICEHNNIPDFQSIPSHELYKASQDTNVFNKKSLDEFRSLLFSPFDADVNHIKDVSHVGKWKITRQQCSRNRVYIDYSSVQVERYLCANGLSHNVNTETESDTVINIISTDRYSIFRLKQLDISKCSKYNECQRNSEKETVDNSTTQVTFHCLDEEDQHINGSCSAQIVHFNISLEYFQCQNNQSQTSYTCIKNEESQCEDNSNLLNCENFTCPEPFFKCPNSYCIFPFQISDETYDCSFGEDDFWVLDQYRLPKVFSSDDKLNFRFVLRDTCMDSFSYDLVLAFTNESGFICDNACPKNYQCVSSRTKTIDQNGTGSITKVNIYSVEMDFINIFNTIYPEYTFYKFLPLISIVHLNAKFFKRGLNNFDEGFLNWNFDELIILDLSRNKDLIHSDNFTSIASFCKLRLLNLSYNLNLIIGHNFSFPRSLEIIDLSHTNLYALSQGTFDSLTYLRHLNLSYTSMSKFEDMGIPEYFNLDTFYIQGLLFNNLETDLFRGLAIAVELQASYYVICCPMILNPSISVDKCHAPVDVISSCKHLVGDTLKRIVVWLVGILTIIGNGVVLVYRVCWNRKIFIKPYGLFITGLAVSDFIMGVYLVSIACVDTYYEDVYVIKDYKWRNSFLCHSLGFLSTLSSETSTFFICLITVDRFLSITYPFGEHRFSKTGKLLSFTLVWLFSLFVALLPVVLSDLDIYSSNGLCLALPFTSKLYKGWLFSFIVFVVLNFVLFVLIAIGQLTIFLNLLRIKNMISSVNQNSNRRSEEWNVAKKLAFVALTDFCCWFPVGILGMLSLQDYIFNREVYAWIAVFVLPINSALNPIIYTIPALYSLCKP